MRKVYVCRQHVIQGLRVTDTPHVAEVSTSTKNHCTFCNEKAHFKLFYNRLVKQQKEALLY
ncbi:hypothetical protein ABLT31_05900 [Ammoniphilus sp. 3BR4]